MQWTWGDPHDGNDEANGCGGRNSTGVADDSSLGLYPTRTAIIYLGPLAVTSGLQGASAGTADQGAVIAIVRVPATRADALRKRASQLKVGVAFKVTDARAPRRGVSLKRSCTRSVYASRGKPLVIRSTEGVTVHLGFSFTWEGELEHS